jgi:Spy/CpxP family protein refolding chaperone
MKSVSNFLCTSAVIGLIGLSGLGKADAQGSVPPAQASSNGQANRQCIEQLNLTKDQKAQLLLLKKQQVSRQQKLEQFIMLLSPTQKQTLRACMQASRQNSSSNQPK